MNRISILGIPIDPLTKPQFLNRVSRIIEAGQKQQITTLYSSMLVSSQRDLEFAKIIQNNSLNVADGIGLLAAGDFLRQGNFFFKIPILRELELLVRGVFVGLKILLGRGFNVIPKRLSGVDLMNDLIGLAAQRGWRVYLLGGKNEDAQRLKDKFVKLYPQLQIEGGEGHSLLEKISFSKTQELINLINAFSPTLLFVAFGPVKQEKWIFQNLPYLKVNIAIGVGGAFDLLSGRIKRAPRFIQKIGLEWLWRLLMNPKNFLKALTAFPLFPLLVAKEKLKMVE